MRALFGSFLVAVAIVATTSSLASQAVTLHVANNGIDSSTCGTSTAPCRSIGQAITNASAGDTIIVGPGSYGDLSENEDYLKPGEEPGGAACGSTRGVVCIDKPLTIESSHGAQATLVSNPLGVEILASGVVFGRIDRGLTVTGGLLRLAPTTSGNSLTGNSFHRVEIDGSGHTFSHNTFEGAWLFFGQLTVSGSDHIVQNNALVRAGAGVFGARISVTDNRFVFSSVDIQPTASDVIVEGNSFLGASGYAVSVMTGTVRINGNNIFGNAVADDFPLDCAFRNYSGTTIDATNNYWGAATGPGLDPADRVCDEAGSTVVSPFATQQFAIASPGGGGAGNGSPVCSAAQAVPTLLWPANGQFVRAWIIGVGDPDDDPVSISVTGVTQDEPVSDVSAGDSGPDAVVFGSSVDLRAQRIGAGNGRVYRVEFSASDGNGGSCTGAVAVGVPNSQKPGQAVVDDGQIYVSTQP